MAKEIPTWSVPDSIVQAWMAEARETCKAFEVEPTKLNQDLNGMSTARLILKRMEVEKMKVTPEFGLWLTQVCKLAGNSSQNRQRFEAKTAKSEGIDPAEYSKLLGLTK